jgi:glucosamine--fructose-6-phosphate aminotransferase (isomerizing)
MTLPAARSLPAMALEAAEAARRQIECSGPPVLADLPPEAAPLAAVQSSYMAVHNLVRSHGLDPDAPANLRKVTETV